MGLQSGACVESFQVAYGRSVFVNFLQVQLAEHSQG